MQFSVQTVISYQMKQDGTRLSRQEAADLAQDYDRAADLAKFIIFDLEEPWHWPLCSQQDLAGQRDRQRQGDLERVQAVKANAAAAKVQTANADGTKAQGK